ncbi:RidA family protein [Flavobacteriaceae bacterium]|nr:RidA family protein [Flavobacteriaceae bacterium]
MSIGQNLQNLNIILTTPATPAANYLPFRISGNQIFISGQLPMKDGVLQYAGKLGNEINLEEGQKAAELCAINIIAVLKTACDGDLNKIKKCVKLGIFINAAADFIDFPKVGNGASDLMVKIFGENGKHARFAIGASSLPRNAAVEIDAVFEIENI